MEQDVDALEQTLFKEYFPAGTEPSTAAPSEVNTEGGDRGNPVARTGGGAKGPPRGKGQAQKDDDAWAAWGRAKRGWAQWDQEKEQGSSAEELRKVRKELNEEIKQLKESLFQVQRLSLRHEDYLGAIRPETSYAIFMRMGVAASIVPAIFQAQQGWRTQKEENPESLDVPMRVVLLRCIFREFSARLAKFPEQKATQETMAKLGWIKADTKDWCYLKWDAVNERLKEDNTRDPLPFAQGIATVEAILVLVGQLGPVTRFHPSRRVEETMKGSVIVFSLQTALLGAAAQQLRDHLNLLSNCSITQLMAFSWRPERPGRSDAANLVQRTIQQPDYRSKRG